MQRKYLNLLLLVFGLVLASNVQAGPLHAAAQSGNIESTKLALQQGADINELGP